MPESVLKNKLIAVFPFFINMFFIIYYISKWVTNFEAFTWLNTSWKGVWLWLIFEPTGILFIEFYFFNVMIDV